jgi:protein-ribulosamine 3-kinase
LFKLDYFRSALFISVMAYFNSNDVVSLCITKLTGLFDLPVEFRNSQMVGGGCINQAIKISTSVGDFFVKWNASAPKDMFLKEAAGLNEMYSAENPFLVIPKVLWYREADELPGILLMEYLQPSIATTGYDERLGRGIAQLHRKTASNFGFHHDNYCGTTIQDNTWNDNWPDFFAQQRIWALVRQNCNLRGMPTDELKIYEKLVGRMPELLAHETVPSMIHGDLWAGNYLFTLHGPALIDPACYYADREMELGMMKFFGGFSPRVWESYQDEFPLPEGWRKRIRLYQLYHILNHYLLFGGSYGRQALEIAKEYL